MQIINRLFIAAQIHMDRLKKDEQGLSTVEYIIILILIAVAGIALWQSFGSAVTSRIGASTSAINGM